MKQRLIRAASGFAVLFLLLTVAGFPPLSAASISVVVLRAYFIIDSRRRRRRRTEALIAAAPVAARHLASQLRMGSPLSDAVSGAARGAEQAGESAAANFLRGVSRRMQLGADADEALHSSIAAVCDGGTPPMQFYGLCQMIATLQCNVAVLASALERMAESLDSENKVKRRARSEMTEARFVSAAIVMFAGAVCVLLSIADAAVATAALTPPGIYLVMVAFSVACIGVFSVFRVTAVPL